MTNTINIKITADDGVTPVINNIQRSASGLGSTFSTALGTAMGFAVITPMLNGIASALDAIGQSAIGTNAKLEQADIAFTKFLGSGEASAAMLQNLQRFAAETPFDFPTLVTGTQRLLGVGVAAGDVIPIVRGVGDSIAAVGGSAEAVNRVTATLVQMASTGRVTAGDMNQITSAGIPAWNLLAQHMGKSTSEVRDLSEKGLIPAREMFSAFANTVQNTDAAGMMALQSKSFVGSISTIKDSLDMLIAGAFKPAFEEISNFARMFANALSSEPFQQFAADAQRAITIVVGAFKELFSNGDVIAFGDAIGRVGTMILDGLVNAITAAIPVVANIISTLGDLAANALIWGYNLAATYGQGIMQGAADVIVAAVTAVGNMIAEFFASFSPPKKGPLSEIDTWGANLMNTYLGGFTKADFSLLNEVGKSIETALQAALNMDQIADVDLIPKLLGGKGIVAEGIAQLREFGRVSEDVFQRLSETVGSAGDQVVGLFRKLIDAEETKSKIEALNRSIKTTEQEIRNLKRAREDELGDLPRRIRDLTEAHERETKAIDNKIAALNRSIAARKKDLGVGVGNQALDEEEARLEVSVSRSDVTKAETAHLERAKAVNEDIKGIDERIAEIRREANRDMASANGKDAASRRAEIAQRAAEQIGKLEKERADLQAKMARVGIQTEEDRLNIVRARQDLLRNEADLRAATDPDLKALESALEAETKIKDTKKEQFEQTIQPMKDAETAINDAYKDRIRDAERKLEMDRQTLSELNDTLSAQQEAIDADRERLSLQGEIAGKLNQQAELYGRIAAEAEKALGGAGGAGKKGGAGGGAGAGGMAKPDFGKLGNLTGMGIDLNGKINEALSKINPEAGMKEIGEKIKNQLGTALKEAFSNPAVVGAGLGTLLGGVVGGIIGGPFGIAIGAVLGGALGTALGGLFNNLNLTGALDVGKIIEALADIPHRIISWIDSVVPQIAGALVSWTAAFVGWIVPMLPELAGKYMELQVAITGWLLGIGAHMAQVLLGWAKAFGEWVAPAIGEMFSKLGTLVQSLIGWLQTHGPGDIFSALGTWARAFADWVSVAIPAMMGALGGLLSAIGSWISTNGPAIASQLLAWGKAFGEWVTTTAIPALNTALGVLFDIIKQWTIDQLPAIGEALRGWGEAFGNWVTETAIPAITGKLGELKDKVVDFITNTSPSDIRTGFEEWVRASVDWITETAIPELSQKLSDFKDKMLSWVGETKDNIVSEMPGWKDAFITWIVNDAIPGLIDNLGKFKDRMITFLTETVPTIISTLLQWREAFIQWIIDNIPGLLGNLAQFLLALTVWIAKAVVEIQLALGEWALAFLGWIAKDVIPFMAGKLGEIITAIAGWITGTAVPWALGALQAVGTAIVDGIRAGIMSAWTALETFITGKVQGLLGVLNAAIKAGSPSKLFAEKIGVPIAQGIALGIEQGFVDVIKAATDGIGQVYRATTIASGAFDNFYKHFPNTSGLPEGLDILIPRSPPALASGVTMVGDSFAHATPDVMAFFQAFGAMGGARPLGRDPGYAAGAANFGMTSGTSTGSYSYKSVQPNGISHDVKASTVNLGGVLVQGLVEIVTAFSDGVKEAIGYATSYGFRELFTGDRRFDLLGTVMGPGMVFGPDDLLGLGRGKDRLSDKQIAIIAADYAARAGAIQDVKNNSERFLYNGGTGMSTLNVEAFFEQLANMSQDQFDRLLETVVIGGIGNPTQRDRLIEGRSRGQARIADDKAYAARVNAEGRNIGSQDQTLANANAELQAAMDTLAGAQEHLAELNTQLSEFVTQVDGSTGAIGFANEAQAAYGAALVAARDQAQANVVAAQNQVTAAQSQVTAITNATQAQVNSATAIQGAAATINTAAGTVAVATTDMSGKVTAAMDTLSSKVGTAMDAVSTKVGDLAAAISGENGLTNAVSALSDRMGSLENAVNNVGTTIRDTLNEIFRGGGGGPNGNGGTGGGNNAGGFSISVNGVTVSVDGNGNISVGNGGNGGGNNSGGTGNTGNTGNSGNSGNTGGNPPGMASGGAMIPGQIYNVGENGPETVISGGGGVILPSSLDKWLRDWLSKARSTVGGDIGWGLTFGYAILAQMERMTAAQSDLANGVGDFSEYAEQAKKDFLRSLAGVQQTDEDMIKVMMAQSEAAALATQATSELTGELRNSSLLDSKRLFNWTTGPTDEDIETIRKAEYLKGKREWDASLEGTQPITVDDWRTLVGEIRSLVETPGFGQPINVNVGLLAGSPEDVARALMPGIERAMSDATRRAYTGRVGGA